MRTGRFTRRLSCISHQITIGFCGLGILAALGCSAPPGPPPARQSAAAESTLAQPPVAVLPDGVRITLELAITPQEHEQGLMFRPRMAKTRGMLFLFKRPSLPSFWMKNTIIPLDIVFLDSAGVVVYVASDAQPCYADPCPEFRPTAPTRAVLEVNAGTARSHGIVPGAKITFGRVSGMTKK